MDAEATDPGVAKEAIERIREQFQVEEAAKDLGDAARAALRVAQSRPRLEEFGAWMELAETKVLPKSPAGQAICYARNQ